MAGYISDKDVEEGEVTYSSLGNHRTQSSARNYRGHVRTQTYIHNLYWHHDSGGPHGI
jgi:hypothetical protein